MLKFESRVLFLHNLNQNSDRKRTFEEMQNSAVDMQNIEADIGIDGGVNNANGGPGDADYWARQFRMGSVGDLKHGNFYEAKREEREAKKMKRDGEVLLIELQL